MEETKDVLNQFESIPITRRKLLPWWIRVCCWIFMIVGGMAFLCLLLGVLGMNVNLAFYGFETTDALSPTGLFLIGIAVFKGITAYALWFEKDYAITLGKIDAILGIAVCTTAMIILPFINDDSNFVLRLELVFLIPYLIKLIKIQPQWFNQ